jgi:Transposase DDE domain
MNKIVVPQLRHTMIINELKVIELFCELDDFCSEFDRKLAAHLIANKPAKSVNTPEISISEMMCIEILYHHSGYKCFQYYYKQEVEKGYLKTYFPKAPSYNRFVQLKPRMLFYLIFYMNLCRIGQLCGIYYADSTKLGVCHNRRIGSNKVFKGKATRGKTSTGWFYGFKLFLVINAFGEIMSTFFTPANVADNQLSIMIKIFSKLKGWAFADKGFINQKAFEELFSKGLHLVTGIRKNMKNKLVDMDQKLLLKKRGVIESVNDILKTVCDIEHTRHRSPVNMLVNLYAGLCSYTWLDRLPSIF